MAKNLVSGPILAHKTQIQAAKFLFSKIWLRQSLDMMVSYHHVHYQKKLMIQSWESLVTDRQTDKSDFIGRYRLTSSVRYENRKHFHLMILIAPIWFICKQLNPLFSRPCFVDIFKSISSDYWETNTFQIILTYVYFYQHYICRARSLVVSVLHSETNGSRFESGC